MSRCFTLILLLAFCQGLFIRELTESELKNFLIYRSNTVISPFKSEDKVESKNIENYLPVKISMVNNPKIQIYPENMASAVEKLSEHGEARKKGKSKGQHAHRV